jgi:photosystem II stability/assembly factor-like uncharacterized protein/uncharacterized membrane protein YgcG
LGISSFNSIYREVKNVKKLERFLMCAILSAAMAALVVAPRAIAQRGGGQGGGRGGRGGPGGGAGGGGGTYGALRLRNIGPALVSGRIVTIAVDPTNKRHYFIGAASGGVWRTTNGGITFTPVFDNEDSYSIGFVTLDPKNPAVVWVGTGENNSQRSVSWGDGVYKSDDDGRTWHNMGLKKSEHIARILIDPRNSDVIYVASQGPLWGPGGDRGLFKSTDGGKTWKNILSISEWTGVTDVIMEPGNPDVMYAASYQRERRVWTLIDGGPESAIYKSTDAGATWNKLRGGLPGGDLGRIGLGISPAKPNLVYAEIEAANRAGGVFASEDRGETWEKRDDFDSSSPQYYSTIFVDPKDAERIYVMDTNIMTSDDGGRTTRSLGTRSKHVDNHVVWIDPDETDHLMIGCDGGLYESYNRGEDWTFKENLPLGQFYDVTADTSAPFYYVYGGTQDNSSYGGPSRTRSVAGILNMDWFNTQGGDGFTSAVDPEDPNTVYAELQNGAVVRYDRKTGERVDIVPSEGPGEPALRWNWDSPIIVSSHVHTRIYFAANKVFRSDDRGDSWKAISGDITRQIDRNTLPMMGRVWPPEAVAKNTSTSFYGNATALAESPKKDGMVYVGTDDGLISVTEDGGAHWRKIETFTGVPEMTYVTRIVPSSHDVNTVYASFDGHKNEDFKPYILKSTDAGKTWASIAGDLPDNGPVLAIAEDPVDPNLIFVGTEYGLFFTQNGGTKWTRLRNGLPTIAVRDLHIQKAMGDLVVGTFGRSIWILDDYTPLRTAAPEKLADTNAEIFPIRTAWQYFQTNQFGGGGKAHLGEQLYEGENPPVGAMITYYEKAAPQTLRAKRQADERDAERNNAKIHYPTIDELRAEAEEQPAELVFTITDASGNFVRQLTAPAAPGMRRITWDMHAAPFSVPAAPVAGAAGGRGGRGGGGGGGGGFFGGGAGPLVAPGTYKVSMAQTFHGATTQLAGPVQFTVEAIDTEPLSPAERAAKEAFQKKAAKLQSAVTAALEIATNNETELATIKRALTAMPYPDGAALIKTTDELEKRNNEILMDLRGDTVAREHEEPVPPSISQRASRVVQGTGSNTAKPTKTMEDDYKIAGQLFAPVLAKLRLLVEVDMVKLDKALDADGVPHTPGRVPNWKDQ